MDIPFPSGNAVEKPKALLVARGSQKVDGIDYKKTFAAVVMISSVHYLLPFVVHLHKMGVVTAFLHGEVEKNI